MKKYQTILATAVLLAPSTGIGALRRHLSVGLINPADPGLGKQQGTTLAPDGAGVNAAPAANLNDRNLTMAYLIGANLPARPQDSPILVTPS